MAMAFPLLLVLLLFVFPTFFPFTTQDAVLLDNVCKQTDAYGLCVSALLSDPRSPGADLRGLALVSIDLVLENLTDTRAAIGELLKSASDPNLKETLGQCRFLYGEQKATQYALSAFRSWKSMAYDDMSSQANDVGYFASVCQNIFDQWGIHPSPLGPRNDNLVHLTEITTVIGRMLTK
ncbi:hypothetical protein ACLOJK_017755 [Asimina triloba]